MRAKRRKCNGKEQKKKRRNCHSASAFIMAKREEDGLSTPFLDATRADESPNDEEVTPPLFFTPLMLRMRRKRVRKKGRFHLPSALCYIPHVVIVGP